MKNILMAALAAALLILSGAVSSTQAQIAYTNAVLNGCYSYLNTSVDTQTGAYNRDGVGTLCFDGNGHVVINAGPVYLTGGCRNTNGAVSCAVSTTGGTYSVTNNPGDGMGTITVPCNLHAFSINTVDSNGLAHGFQFELIKRLPGTGCNPTHAPKVIGGTAYLQQ